MLRRGSQICMKNAVFAFFKRIHIYSKQLVATKRQSAKDNLLMLRNKLPVEKYAIKHIFQPNTHVFLPSENYNAL